MYEDYEEMLDHINDPENMYSDPYSEQYDDYEYDYEYNSYDEY